MREARLWGVNLEADSSRIETQEDSALHFSREGRSIILDPKPRLVGS
jgi:hypothetical protein